MTSDRTIDLVKRSEACHRTLQAYYRQLKAKVANERVRLALDYLIAHEASMEAALRQYETHVPNNVAERWFQYSPNEELERLLAASDLPTDLTIEQLSTWVVRLNDGLIQYYRQFE
jgi:16S rRNA C967 or C1407 C5-methylase (RsmB/RsmF family)